MRFRGLARRQGSEFGLWSSASGIDFFGAVGFWANSLNYGSFWVPCFVRHSERDPSLENYPYSTLVETP